MAVSLNIEQLKDFLRHIVANNRVIQSTKNMTPVATAIEGDSGIGKTSSMLQLSEELGLDVVKLNLSQIEELGDLVGFPIRQFQVCKDVPTQDGFGTQTQCEWIDEHAVDSYTAMNWKFTGTNRMSYCPPEWIADKKRGGILILDDYNRADPRFMQATMELIDRQQYISWSLPEDWHIVLTNNPDNGDYNVTSIDNAQKTRFIKANLKFDIECWARWAEKHGVDSRCINFLLLHPELVTVTTNARSITTFFNCLHSIDSFETSLPLIQMIGEGSVGDEFSSLFTMFINNKLDKLMPPKEILFGDKGETILKKLKDSINVDDNYRADIASTIATRVINYAVLHADTNPVEKSLVTRISSLITEDIFTNDLKYVIVKGIFNGNKTKYRNMMLDKDLVKFTLA